MKNYYYLLEIELILKVNKTNIFQTLSRMHDMIFNINNILNNFLKIISILFAKTIIIFIQIF